MDHLYDLVIHPRLLERLARKAYDSALHPGTLSSRELHAARWALDVLRQGREEFFEGKRLGRSDGHVDLRDCAEIKVAVVQEYNSRGRPLGPSHRMIYREYASSDLERPVREVISFAPRAGGLPFKLAGNDLDRPIGMELNDLESMGNTPPAVGPGKDKAMATSPVQTSPPPDVSAVLATRLRRSPCDPALVGHPGTPLALRALGARRVPPPMVSRSLTQSTLEAAAGSPPS